jgi:hypothetical protein
VDFFNADELAGSVANVLAAPETVRPLRHQARQSIVDGYDLQTTSLPNLLSFIHQF